MVKDVTDDLAKIFAGIEMPARPAGAQIAMQGYSAVHSAPDVAQRAQQDEAFAARLKVRWSVHVPDATSTERSDW